MAHFREVLFKKNFFSLWSGQIISEFGDRLNQMALISLVYSKSPGSVFALAKIIFFIVIPVFAIGPVAGVYVDRWDRKKVMIIADVLRALFVLVIPLFVYLGLMVPVYIMVFLIFSATRFFLPSKMALIPDIVPEEKLVVANSLSNTTRMIASVLGFALAGLVVKWVGHMCGFYLDSASYFLSAALIAIITPKKALKNVKEDFEITKELIERSLRKNIWHQITEGFNYMIKNDKMKVVTSSVFLLMAGAGSIFCVIIVFIQESFGSVTQSLGALGVFLGVGLFAGTVLFGKFCQNYSKIRSIFISFTLSGIFVSVFTLYTRQSPVFMVSGLLISLVGVVVAPILICTNTLIHMLIPNEARGRIFSSVEVVIHLAFLVFMFTTAFLSKYFSNMYILFLSGIIFSLAGVVGIIFFRKEKM